MSTVFDYSSEIANGIRNLLLGRVLLKEDYTAGDNIVKVGQEDVYEMPGGYLFRNRTNEAKLVEPASSNKPGAIDHQENVTITSTNALHVIIQPATQDYTVAAGAYLALRTPPIPNIKVIYTDPLGVTIDEIHEKRFPAVAILRPRVNFRQGPSGFVIGNYNFIIRYARLHEAGTDTGAAVLEDTEAIVNLLAEDCHLGGTVEDSSVVGVSEVRNARVQRGVVVHFVDIHLTAQRSGIYDKF